MLPVVCSQGEDIASNLEVLSKYPSWQRQRQIYVLDRNVCPTLGEVVYLGGLGLKGGSGGEASGSGEQRGELPSVGPRSYPVELEPSLSVAFSLPDDDLPDLSGHVDLDASQALSSTVASESQIPPSAQPLTNQEEGDTQSPVDQLKALASDPQIDQQPGKLVELGNVLLKLAASKQEESGASAQDLSPYTEAAILYQHVLSICEQKADTLSSQAASTLGQSAYQGLAQTQAAMLALAKGEDSEAIREAAVEQLQEQIDNDRKALQALRDDVAKEAKRLVVLMNKQGDEQCMLAYEGAFIEGTKNLFFDIAEQIKPLLARLYRESEALLGPPPCKYAIMGLGSIALQQTTPYSDLEFAILMEDAPDEDTAEERRNYFRKLTHLVHFRVINLGETVLPFSDYKISLDHLGRKGLNFDLGGKTPLGRKDKDRADKNKGYELIQPVAGMMAYLKNEGNKMEHIDKLLPYILERTCYMYGDRGLHDRYLASQKEFWSSCQDAAGKHAYQERMRKILLEGITELDYSQPGEVKAGRKQAGNLRTVGPKLHPEDAGRLYDVKQEIYRLPDRLLYGLAMYFGICPESAWDAVDKLKDKHIIGVEDSAKQASHRLKYAVSFATMLRLDTYLCHRQQNEKLSLRGSLFQGESSGEGSSQAVHKFFLLPQATSQEDRSLEDSSLFKYYYTALALHREMNGFFKVLHLRSQLQPDCDLHRMLSGFSPGGQYTAGQEKAYFCSFGFYDTSCAAKLAIYNRLLHYEQAAKCAEGHLEKVKAGYNKKKLARAHHNLGVSYYHLGSFDKSFDHFDNSLRYLKELYPDGDPQVAAVLRSLGIAHYNLSEFQESLEHFERSLKMLQDLYRENNPETAQALVSVGAAHEQLESFQQSIKHKQEALAMFRALYGKSHPEVARALLSLGESYALDGNLAASLDHKQDALEMFKDLCGKSHPEVARALLSLGDVYAALENFEASLEHKQEALEILQALYGSSHPEVARALLSLGESYEAMGQLAESKEYKNKSVAMFEVFYKDTHSEVSQARKSLSRTKSTHISVLEGGNPVHTTGPSLPRVRTVYPQPLTLLPTPRHGKEPAGENTLLRNYYSKTDFPYVKSLFDEHRSRHVKDLECQLMLLEQKQVISFETAMQLRTLALEDPNPEVRKKNIEDLISLVQPSSGESETSVRACLLNGLALVATQSQPDSNRKAEAAMAGKALEGLTAKAPTDHWLAAETLPDKLWHFQRQHFQEQAIQSNPHEQDRLFIRVRRASSPATTDRADHVAKYYERLEWVKTPLGSEDLFKKRSIRPGDPEKEISRILLIGDPGTGKTTLSRQLAYQWSQGLWGQEFYTLYLLPVRSLQQSEYDGRGYDRKRTLSTAIVNNCFTHPSSDEDEYKQLRKHIEEELQKTSTLLILDGLDERAGASEEILKQAQAGSHKLLMLSRPYGIETERQRVDIEIEHVGFNRVQLRSYVLAEVSDGEQASELLDYIDKHENIRSIAHVPVNLQILCALWQDEGYDVREVAQQGSLPGLYRLVTEYTWQRYKERASAVVSVQGRDELFAKLGQIALRALSEGEVLISPGLIDRTLSNSESDANEVKTRCKDAGFLLLQYVGEDADRQRGFYEFPHLTFQEYFAGRWIAKQFLEEKRNKVKEFLDTHKYDPQYRRTLSFLAGEVAKQISKESQEEQHSTLEKLLELLDADFVEIVGAQHTLLKARTLHEWLCLAGTEEAGGLVNTARLHVAAPLARWFSRSIKEIKRGQDKPHEERKCYQHLCNAWIEGISSIRAVITHYPEIIETLRTRAQEGEDWLVRYAAIEALIGLDKKDALTGQILRKIAQEDKNSTVRQAAKAALEELNEKDASMIWQIFHKAVQENNNVRHVATPTPEELDNEQWLDCSTTIKELVEQEKDSVDTVGTLCGIAQNHKDKYVRCAAIDALIKVEKNDVSVLCILSKIAQKDEHWLVRRAAVDALIKVGKNNVSVFYSLIKIVQKEKEPSIQHAVTTALDELPVEQLINGYWDKKGSEFIPYIVRKLYQTPLVVDLDQHKAVLYLKAGEPKAWQQPAQDIRSFVELIKNYVQCGEIDARHAAILSAAESKGPTPLEIAQIEAKRLKKQIDQRYPKLSEATDEADAQQLVEALITLLERLVELEGFWPEDSLGKACAQDCLVKLREDVKSRKLALDQTRDQQLIQLLEKSYSGSLKQLVSATVSSQKVQLIEVLEKLAALSSDQGAITQDLSHYTDAAILYQHILSICAKEQDTLDSEAAAALEESAYHGLVQLQASMLAQAKGADAEVAPPEEVASLQERIAEDRNELEAFRDAVKPKATALINNLEDVLSNPQSSDKAITQAEEAYIQGSQALFGKIAQWMGKFLARLYRESEATLGPAPCKYTVMGLGSMALQQITPYSDLEFAILMEDVEDKPTAEVWREYFRKLTHLVHFRVINLGETVVPISKYMINLEPLGKRGVHFSLSGKTPLGRKDKPYELIQPVAGMMHYLENKEAKQEHRDKRLPSILESTCYVYGDQGLHNKYKEKKRKFLLGEDNRETRELPEYQARAKKNLVEGVEEMDYTNPWVARPRYHQGDLERFAPKFGSEDAGRLYDVKREIYGVPDRLLYWLAMYYGILPTNGWDAVDQLAQHGIIGVGGDAQQAAHHLHYAVSFATMLRLQTYLHHGQQLEEATMLSKVSQEEDARQAVQAAFTLPASSLQAGGTLFKYYYTVLPLHRKMKKFFKTPDSRSKALAWMAANPRQAYELAPWLESERELFPSQEGTFFQEEIFYDSSAETKGAIYRRLLQNKKAKDCYEEALPIDEQVYKEEPNHPEIAAALNNLGSSWRDLGDASKAVSFLERALAIYEQVYKEEPNHPEIAAALNNLGSSWRDLGDASKAVSFLERALAIYEQVYKKEPNHPEIAAALNNLGSSWRDLGDASKAVSFLERALAIYEQVYGPNPHPEIANILMGLGLAWRDLGDARQAVSFLERALAIYEQVYGPNHPKIANILMGLGNAWRDLGDARQAVSFLERALEIYEQVYKEDSNHPETAAALNNLASSWRDLGDASKAVSFLERALATYEQVYQEAPNHPEIARTLNNLGLAWSALGDSRQAVAYHERSLGIYEQVYQETPNHPEIARTSTNLGLAWSALGDSRQAVVYHERSLGIYEYVYDSNHPEIARTSTNLGLAWSALGDSRQAVAYHERSLGIYEQVYKEMPNHPEIARTSTNLGLACSALGNFQHAVDRYKRSLGIYEQLYELHHPEIARTLNNLANAYYKQNDVEKAIKHYEKALSRLPSDKKDSKIDFCYNLGCMYHITALAARQVGDEKQAQAYLEKATISFEQAIQARDTVKVGLWTEYGNFLLATGKAAQAYDHLHQAIESGDDESGLSYSLLEQPTVTSALQAYIRQHQKVSLRGIDYAYYLMIHHYEDFQKAGIEMDKTREEYLAAYQASLDQCKGQPGKAQEDKAAYHLLGSLYKAQGDQEAAATAFARAQDGTEQKDTQAAA